MCCFLIPYAPKKFIIGSTYNWQDTTWEATPAGKAELLTKVNDLVETPFAIIEHTAGVRPTTHDRRPTLGTHYMHKNMFVFNGLGTKGVLLAPYLANHLAQYMHNETHLMPEVNVSRYKAL
jgi:glycine oxidase